MSEKAPIFTLDPLAWGIATAEGQTFVTVDTGITVDGQTIYRLELGSPAAPEPLVDDDSGEILIDDATGTVLWDG